MYSIFCGIDCLHFVTAKELSNEVGRLQNLLLQKKDDANSVSPRSPYTSPRTRSRNICKGSSKKKTPNSSSRQSEIQYKEATSIPCENRQQQQIVVCKSL